MISVRRGSSQTRSVGQRMLPHSRQESFPERAQVIGQFPFHGTFSKSVILSLDGAGANPRLTVGSVPALQS